MILIDEDYFKLSKSDIDRFNKWQKTLPEARSTAIGGRLTFKFTPTSIGCFIVVKDSVSKEELALSNL